MRNAWKSERFRQAASPKDDFSPCCTDIGAGGPTSIQNRNSLRTCSPEPDSLPPALHLPNASNAEIVRFDISDLANPRYMPQTSVAAPLRPKISGQIRRHLVAQHGLRPLRQLLQNGPHRAPDIFAHRLHRLHIGMDAAVVAGLAAVQKLAQRQQRRSLGGLPRGAIRNAACRKLARGFRPDSTVPRAECSSGLRQRPARRC